MGGIFETILGGILWHNVCRGCMAYGAQLLTIVWPVHRINFFSFRFNFKSRWPDLFTVLLSLRKLPTGASLSVFWVIFVYFRVFSTVLRGGCW